MKKIIIFLGFLALIGSTFAYNFSIDSFFDPNYDPFQEFKKMEQQMMQQRQEMLKQFNNFENGKLRAENGEQIFPNNFGLSGNNFDNSVNGKWKKGNGNFNSTSIQITNNTLSIILQRSDSKGLDQIQNNIQKYCDENNLEFSSTDIEDGKKFTIKGEDIWEYQGKVNEIINSVNGELRAESGDNDLFNNFRLKIDGFNSSLNGKSKTGNDEDNIETGDLNLETSEEKEEETNNFWDKIFPKRIFKA